MLKSFLTAPSFGHSWFLSCSKSKFPLRRTAVFFSSSGIDKDSSSSPIKSAASASNDVGAGLNAANQRHHIKFQSPIVAKLWEARQNEKNVKQSQSHSELEEPILKKHPKDSLCRAYYPFTTDEYLKEAYKSPGGTMRFGKILEDLDALAANVAFQHVTGNPMLVTAAVDRIALRRIPKPDYDHIMTGQVTWVGTSSMEIRVCLYQGGQNTTTKMNHHGEEEWLLEAFFTFVAVDPQTNKPTKIIPIIPETNQERELFELGALKAAKKKEERNRGSFMDGKGNHSEEVIRMEKKAKELLQQAFPLLRMPSLADLHSILMEKTCLENSVIAQPQTRNLNDRIFGGFLMRKGFELAFATAYVFGGEWPIMLEVDNVTFISPVDVGDLLQFKSRVIYSLPEGGNLGIEVADHKGKPLVMVEVECWITEPAKVQAHLSNKFYFTFLLPTKKSS